MKQVFGAMICMGLLLACESNTTADPPEQDRTEVDDTPYVDRSKLTIRPDSMLPPTDSTQQ